jgi:hypothetical protein
MDFWVVATCFVVVGYQRFRGLCCLHLQDCLSFVIFFAVALKKIIMSHFLAFCMASYFPKRVNEYIMKVITYFLDNMCNAGLLYVEQFHVVWNKCNIEVRLC